jgi:MerR family transcriptional regulator, light-induced transcriptional regulator
MGKYSIKELEQLSGIKAHTIRIWEKRHQLIAPKRTETNIRFYSDEDLKKIINVSVLNNHGLKISKIASLTPDALNKQVAALAESNNKTDIYIDQLVVALMDMDEEAFEHLIASLHLKFGLERTITEIIYPYLDKIGILWQTGNITPAQEHFISNLIRQKLIVAIDGLRVAPPTAKRAVLFLPENELHEIGLLFQYYLVKKERLRTYYLGQSVPHDDLKKVVAEHKPHYLITSMTSHPQTHSLQTYIHQLSKDFPKSRIYLSGAIIRKATIKSFPNVKLLDNALTLREMLKD